jgi:hypothetical protein
MFQVECIINGNMVMGSVEDAKFYFELLKTKFKNQLTIQLDQERVVLGMRAMQMWELSIGLEFPKELRLSSSPKVPDI